MDSLRSISLVLAFLMIALSASVFSQPDSEIVKVVKKNRTTDLMTGSVFEVQFASGGTEKFNYVTHNEEYCRNHSDASGCPPEEFPTKPPIMQKFEFKNSSNKTGVYKPEDSICLEDSTYINCEGFSRIKVIAGEFLN